MLFAGSVGRSDLPGGDSEQLMRQPARQAADPRTTTSVVLPGHGPTTTIGRERATNPFLQDLDVPTRGRWL